MSSDVETQNPHDTLHGVSSAGRDSETESSGPALPAEGPPEGPRSQELRPQPTSRVTLPLLLEVGCEEIPARFLVDAERQFAERLLATLKDLRLLRDGVLAAAKVHSYSTPRRLVAYVQSVLVSQPDAVEEITGPPAKVAFDAAGSPTRAAES